MKSWYDLTEKEREKLRDEFSKKNVEKINSRLLMGIKITFYILSFLSFFGFASAMLSKMNGYCTKEVCGNVEIIFLTIFIITIGIALICSVYQSRFQRRFNTWLKSKNILK